MKEAVREFCRSLDIEHVGIAPVGPYLELKAILQSRRKKNQDTEFEEPCIEKRINPKLTMAEAESIIVCLFPYYTGEKANANLAKYTYGLDYHRVVKEKLEKIGSFCKSKIIDFNYTSFADTGPLVDRYLAYLAGLGIYGQNNQIINEQYGSYVLIGYLLTNCSFASDGPLNGSCMQCGRCAAACPGQAIQGNFTIDAKRCRSYLTQKKGELTVSELDIIKKDKLVFGCDICQEVCPHNQKVPVTKIAEFQENRIFQLNYEEIGAISNKEFKRKYGNHAFSWRGRKQLLRNFEYLR